MNLCLVCNQYPPLPPGGHGARTSVLARQLVTRGHDVTVVGVVPANVGLTTPTEEWLDGVRVFRLPPSGKIWRWRPGELWARWRLCRVIRRLHRRNRFDLIDCADSAGWMCFGAVQKIPLTVRFAATVKLYAELGPTPHNPFITALEARTLAQGTHFYAPSRWAASETLRAFGYTNRPCEVIHNGVDVNHFAPSQSGITEPGLIVYAGGIEPRKGIRELLLSMNLWGRTHPHARLVLIGSDTWPRDNGNTFSALCLQELHPDLRSRVQFTGHLDRTTELLQWLQAAELCVYPSYFETFGIAVIEAMSVGKPVIFTRDGSGPELVEDRVSGVLCDTTSPSDLAARIQELLDRPDWAAELGRQARRRVLERFNNKLWAERCEAFFRLCIDEMNTGGERLSRAHRGRAEPTRCAPRSKRC